MFLQTALTCCLIRLLCNWDNSLSVSLVYRTRRMMKRRDFFKRMRVELILHHNDDLLIWFFYTQRLYTRGMLMGLFGMDNFRITTVTFYKDPDVIELVPSHLVPSHPDVMKVSQNPQTLVSKPTKRTAVRGLEQFFTKIPKKSDGSFQNQ